MKSHINSHFSYWFFGRLFFLYYNFWTLFQQKHNWTQETCIFLLELLWKTPNNIRNRKLITEWMNSHFSNFSWFPEHKYAVTLNAMPLITVVPSEKKNHVIFQLIPDSLSIENPQTPTVWVAKWNISFVMLLSNSCSIRCCGQTPGFPVWVLICKKLVKRKKVLAVWEMPIDILGVGGRGGSAWQKKLWLLKKYIYIGQDPLKNVHLWGLIAYSGEGRCPLPPQLTHDYFSHWVWAIVQCCPCCFMC